MNPSLFEYLGVSPVATASEVEAAFVDAIVRHGGPDRVPMMVGRAYSLLRDTAFRENYLSVLTAWTRQELISIADQDLEEFRVVCREGGLIANEVRDRPGVFRITRP